MRFSKIILIVLCFSGLRTTAQNIKNPTVHLPHLQFDTLYNQQKIENPIYLNGNVASVNKTCIQHISLNSDFAYNENYNYKLDKNKQVISYSSDVDYFEDESITFNEKPDFKTTKDTIIQKGNEKYVFKSGLLTLKEVKDYQIGNLDSIVFSYSKGKLKSETHYVSQGMYEMDENGDIDENVMLYEAYNVRYYSVLNYNKNGLIVNCKNYEVIQDFITTNEIIYNYNNNGNLIKYSILNAVYDVNSVDIYTHPKEWVFKKEFEFESDLKKVNGTYTYDNLGRIVSHHYKTSKQESDVYKVEYSKNGYIIKVSSDYLNRSKILHQDLEYEFTLDHLKNPIQIDSYIIKDKKRVIDKSTVLEITYY